MSDAANRQEFAYDRREISLWGPDPMLHSTTCPDAPPSEHAVGFHPLPGTTDVAAAAVALRSHSCVPGGPK